MRTSIDEEDEIEYFNSYGKKVQSKDKPVVGYSNLIKRDFFKRESVVLKPISLIQVQQNENTNKKVDNY